MVPKMNSYPTVAVSIPVDRMRTQHREVVGVDEAHRGRPVHVVIVAWGLRLRAVVRVGPHAPVQVAHPDVGEAVELIDAADALERSEGDDLVAMESEAQYARGGRKDKGLWDTLPAPGERGVDVILRDRAAVGESGIACCRQQVATKEPTVARGESVDPEHILAAVDQSVESGVDTDQTEEVLGSWQVVGRIEARSLEKG